MINKITGKYFPSKSPVEKEADIELSLDSISVKTTDGKSKTYVSKQIKISPQIGRTNINIEFDDGSLFVCQNCKSLQNWQNKYTDKTNILHNLEKSLSSVIIFAVIGALIVWLFVQYGIPKTSHFIAQQLPVPMQKTIGAHVLTVLDKTVFEKSKLSKKEQLKIKKVFARLKSGILLENTVDPKLYFRYGGKIGANALAIPDGSIIVTDEFVRWSKKTDNYEDALYGVLAHEIGHLYHRHALRAVIEASILPIFLTFIGGDLINSTQIAASIPVMLLETGHTRYFEKEADEYALQVMLKNNINTKPTGQIFALFAKEGGEDGDGMQILSTHPSHKSREKFFMPKQH